MEILPVRPDCRQFVEWRVGGIPPPPPLRAVELLPAAEPPLRPQFDRAWCVAVSADGWMVRVDAGAGDMRAKVLQNGSGDCTLRSAAPLPSLGPSPRVGPGRQQQQLPACRIIVEAYSGDKYCYLGLVPGGVAATAVAPTRVQYAIHNYGGWSIAVAPSRAGAVHRNRLFSGWKVIPPVASIYATTAEVPPVPEGGAVEFAVDYSEGTCRVAFYTRAAVAGGFVEAPHAKMELRFVATATGEADGRPIPARTVPTAADSVMALYPAAETYGRGSIWCFAAL
jgi:hypothetical protein